jgi:ADP-heptose:LPS heptosyltransferase
MNVVHQRGNIYKSYFDFTMSDLRSSHFAYKSLQNIDTFTIFPESRMKKKEIGQQDLEILLRKIKHVGKKATVAFFKESKLALNANIVTHNSFSDLINLVQSAQFIITADSLPAHLAQMFQIPHLILYSRKIDTEWITPYALENKQAYRLVDIKRIEF